MKNSTVITISTLLDLVAVPLLSLGAGFCWLGYQNSSFLLFKLACLGGIIYSAYQTLKIVYKFLQLTRGRLVWKRLGYSENPIPIDHGATLTEVFTRLKDEQVACIGYFSPLGEKICEYTMNSPYIATPDERKVRKLIKQPGSIVLCNYPCMSAGLGQTSDILIAMQCKASRLIVMAGDFCFVTDFSHSSSIKLQEVQDFAREVEYVGGRIVLDGIEGPEDYPFAEQLRATFNDPLAAKNYISTLTLVAKFQFGHWLVPASEKTDVVIEACLRQV